MDIILINALILICTKNIVKRKIEMHPVLIAEDYTAQHLLMQNSFEAAGIPFHICKNTELDLSLNLACDDISCVVLNASKLGNEAVQRLCSSPGCRLGPCDFVNIYTYEDTEELSELRRIGITENHPFPYSPASLVEFVSSHISESTGIYETLRNKTDKRIENLISQLNPSGRQRGRIYIREAVLHILFSADPPINLHRDVYSRIAAAHRTTVKSVEHSIRISVESCWQHADKEILKTLIGSSDISRRPTNAGFITAVARFIAAEDPASFPAAAGRLLNSTYPKLHI